MKLEKVEKKVALPEGVTVAVSNGVVTVKGPLGELTRSYPERSISISPQGPEVFVSATNVTKRERKLIGTFIAHIKNMVRGVTEAFVYKLKVCSGHFPMTVTVTGDTLSVKNFIGEAVPRMLKLKEGAKVSVQGADITVESINKEIAGQVAADIEQLTRRTGYDRRIFQDGIYIVQKDKKEITV